MRRDFLFVLSFSIASFTQFAMADGLFLNGISPRSIGRGGTNLGHADNGAVIFDNPAAMTNIQGSWLAELGVDVLITDFEYEDPNTSGTVKSSIGTALPQIAVIKKSEDGHWAYGFGVFTPAGFSESYTMTAGGPFSGDQNYDSFGSLTKVLPALAWAPNDRLSIGGTLGVAISHVEFETPYFISNPLGPSPPVVPLLLDLQGTGAALVWSAGMQYQLSDSTTFGLTYQSQSEFKLDGPASTAIPGVGLVRFDADTRITWPQSLGMGMKHRVNEKGTFSADVIWFDWSESFDNLGISLTPSSTPFPDINESVPLDWKDTVSVRLGYEIDLGAQRIVRFGYVYHRNPIPSSTITPLIQAITEHGFSTGYGFEFYGLEIDLAYMLTVGEDVNVTTSEILGGDFNDSRHGAVTHAISIGAIKRF